MKKQQEGMTKERTSCVCILRRMNNTSAWRKIEYKLQKLIPDFPRFRFNQRIAGNRFSSPKNPTSEFSFAFSKPGTSAAPFVYSGRGGARSKRFFPSATELLLFKLFRRCVFSGRWPDFTISDRAVCVVCFGLQASYWRGAGFNFGTPSIACSRGIHL